MKNVMRVVCADSRKIQLTAKHANPSVLISYVTSRIQRRRISIQSYPRLSPVAMLGSMVKSRCLTMYIFIIGPSIHARAFTIMERKLNTNIFQRSLPAIYYSVTSTCNILPTTAHETRASRL